VTGEQSGPAIGDMKARILDTIACATAAGLAVVFLFKQSVAVSGLCSLLVARALVCSQGGASVQALTGVCTVWCGFTAHIRIVMRTTANKVVQSSMDSQFTHDSTSNQYRAESRRGSEPTAGP
jgi:hypothetical protein